MIDEVIAANDDPESAAPMLRHADLQEALLDASAEDGPITADSRLAGPFAHLIVDEAQELTDAQWRMLLRRRPSGSLTVVGDRAQSRRQFDESESRDSHVRPVTAATRHRDGAVPRTCAAEAEVRDHDEGSL